MIPTARNVDHYAYTVPDLSAAVTFFTDVFGARQLYRQGPVQDPDGDFMAVQLGVHPRAACHVTLLRLGPVSNLELFEYSAPGQRVRPPRLGDLGGHLIAFAVDDLDTAVRWLRGRADITVEHRERVAGDGPFAGDRSRVCRTAWGMYLVLVQPADKPADSRLYELPDSAPAPGLPGLRGVRHLGYTVPDLDVAVEFFCGALGAVVLDVSRATPVERLPGMPGTALARTAVLRVGPVSNVELTEYSFTGQRRVPPANSDIGGSHLAFYVDDLDAAVAYLRGVRGVHVQGDPQLVDEGGGPIDGDRWVYFRSPWGMQLEALSLPPHLPYERATTARRYGPSPRWTVD